MNFLKKLMGQGETIPGKLFDLGQLSPASRYRNEGVIRSLCANAYLGDDRSLCRVLGRYKMFVDTRDIGMSSHLLLEGYWEMWVTEAMCRHVRAGMTVLDIGANLGYFSLLLADLVGPDGYVHAFEPNARMASRLRQTLDVNGYTGRTTLHELALGDHDGEVTLLVPENEPKNGFIAPPDVAGGVTVPLRRLDGVSGIDAVDFIKIDVEGAEEGLWRGMDGLLRGDRPLTIFLEFTPGRYADAGAFLDEILRYGFQLAIIDLARGIIPTDRAIVLAANAIEDQMLVLSR